MSHPARIVPAAIQPLGVYVLQVVPPDRRLTTGLAAGPEAHATHLSEDLARVAAQSDRSIALDLSEIDWIDSGACAVLVRFWRALRAKDRSVALFVTEPVLETFRITGLIRLIPCLPTLEEAIATARSGIAA